MLRDIRTLYSRLSSIADALVLVGILLSFYLISQSQLYPPLEEQLFIFWALFSWVVITAVTRFYYHTRQGVSRFKVAFQIMKALILLGLSMLFYPVHHAYLWLDILVLLLYLAVGIAGSHFFVALLMSYTLKKLKIIPRILVIGDGENGKYVQTYVRTALKDSCKIMGVLNKSGKGDGVLGTWHDYREILNRLPVDEVIFALPHQDHTFMYEIQLFCADLGVRFHWIPLVSRYSALELELEYFGTLPVVMLHETAANLFYALVRKRFFDFSVAVVSILLLSPLFLVVGLMVKLTSSGPLLRRTHFLGVFGAPLVAYSFRTTHYTPDTEAPHYHEKFTSVGSFLHRSRLDLLPYLILVLQGKMSIVGPRPEAWDEGEETQVYHTKRYSDLLLKPGIIGRAQLHAWRMNLKTPESRVHRAEHDMVYCKQWSLSRDILLIWKCFWRKAVCFHLFRHRFWKLPL